MLSHESGVMGIFGKVFKGEKAEKRHKPSDSFVPFITKTQSVPDTLHEAATRFKINLASFDFHLISTQTLIKMDDRDNEWVVVDPDDWQNFNKPEILLTPKFHVKQLHEIEVTRYKEEAWQKDLLMHLATNKEKTRIVCRIKAGSVIRHIEDLDLKIKHKIYKQMLKAKMLIGLWDLDFMETVDEWVAKAKVEGEYFFKEETIIETAACFPSLPAIDDALIYHYRDKSKQPEDADRIDYSKRGFIQAVEKGEIIIEYLKPKSGRPGRNCKGEFIPVHEPKKSHTPDFKVSDNIAVEENDDAILYRAKRGGYVVKEGDMYDIRDEMELEEVSFKKTGSIDAGVETETKLHINEKDYLKEAVGTGVEVEATEVKVEGNVGASAVIRAEKVEIGGQTHQNSEIYADEATVNVIRGLLKVKGDAKVTRLEGGHVEGRKVEVEQMIGGEIRGLEVKVRSVASNTKIFGVVRIEVDEMVGENNLLAIDPANIDAYHDEIVAQEKQIGQIDETLQKLELSFKEEFQRKKQSEEAVKRIKQKILDDRTRGVAPKPAFVAKIKQYQKLIKKIERIKKEIETLHAERERIETKLMEYQEMVLQAKIICWGGWGEYTRIAFHLFSPERVLEYVPQTGAKHQEVYLKRLEKDGEPFYKIVVKDLEV